MKIKLVIFIIILLSALFFYKISKLGNSTEIQTVNAPDITNQEGFSLLDTESESTPNNTLKNDVKPETARDTPVSSQPFDNLSSSGPADLPSTGMGR